MKHNGFTLIEVLVALAILSIALFGIITASGELTHQRQRSHTVTVATWLAQDILHQAQIGLLSIPQPPAKARGQSTSMGYRFQWQASKVTRPGRSEQLVVVVTQDGRSVTTLAGYKWR